MNILIVCNHFAVCSGRYASDALTRLGHNVFHTGTAMGRDIWGMQVPEEYVWQPQFTEYRGYPSYPLTIVMDSATAVLDNPEWLKAAKYQGGKVVCWGVDNHVRDYRRPYFDHYFLAHRSVSVMEWEDTRYTNLTPIIPGFNEHIGKPFDDMTWLPCAYDPVAFPPSPIAWEDRQYDVCMIGVMYPKRWELVKALRAAGLKVMAGTGLVYDAYREAYQNSRIALISSFNGDLPIRLFEGAGMGCAVLCDDIKDLGALSDAFEQPNYEIWRYRSVEDVVEMARYLQTLGEPAAKVNPAWASNHTWDKRCQVILDWVETRS